MNDCGRLVRKRSKTSDRKPRKAAKLNKMLEEAKKAGLTRAEALSEVWEAYGFVDIPNVNTDHVRVYYKLIK